MTLATRSTLFAGYALGVAAVSAGVLQELVRFSRLDEAGSHVVLVPLIAVALIVKDRDTIFASAGFDRIAGAAVILAGLGLMAAGRLADVSPGAAFRIQVAAVAVLWSGGFTLFYGRAAARSARFALFFLLFMIPIPAAVLAWMTHVLKAGSAEVVAALFTLTGTPDHREAYVFTLPTVAIEIGDECSGIRSTLALMMTALLAGDLFLASGWKRALLLAAVLPITILKNAGRIVSLSLLATYVHPSFLVGRLHNDGGIVFFLLALVMLAPVLAILRRSDGPAGLPPGQPSLSV